MLRQDSGDSNPVARPTGRGHFAPERKDDYSKWVVSILGSGDVVASSAIVQCSRSKMLVIFLCGQYVY